MDDGDCHNPANSRLQFTKKLHGRDKELEILHKAYRQVCQTVTSEAVPSSATRQQKHKATLRTTATIPNDTGGAVLEEAANGSTEPTADDAVRTDAVKNCSIVMVSGRAGSGKSALVNTFASEIQDQAATLNTDDPSDYNDGTTDSASYIPKPCYFLYGKFNHLDGDPFAGLSEAFDGFCRQVFNGEDARFKQMQESIKVAVGRQGKILTDIIPCLISILEEVEDNSSSAPEKENDWNRLLYAFKCFLRVICTEQQPVILFLDDLQWADDASLELLRDTLSDDTII